jgi:TolA-binding protein
MRLAIILALLAAMAQAAPPTTCGATDDYGKALCAYQHRNFAAAASGFNTIIERGDKDAQTLHAIYFLARTEMKRGRFDEASKLLIRIYGLDKSFYDAWNCDFLLGECRKATGKD